MACFLEKWNEKKNIQFYLLIRADGAVTCSWFEHFNFVASKPYHSTSWEKFQYFMHFHFTLQECCAKRNSPFFFIYLFSCSFKNSKLAFVVILFSLIFLFFWGRNWRYFYFLKKEKRHWIDSYSFIKNIKETRQLYIWQKSFQSINWTNEKIRRFFY